MKKTTNWLFFSKNTPFASFKMCEIFCSLWCCQLENFLRLFLSIYQLKAKHQIKTIKKFPNFIQCQQSSIYVLGQRMQSRSSSTLKVFFINSKQLLLDKLIFYHEFKRASVGHLYHGPLDIFNDIFEFLTDSRHFICTCISFNQLAK